MTYIKLRPYQQQFIDDVRNQFLLNHKRVVGVAPCGAGKTIMTGWMIKQALKRGKRSIFFVHRQELIKQTSETFSRLDIPHGIICSGVPMQTDLPVQIASVQTLALRLDKIPAPDFLICDECHHILANTYKKIIDKWKDAYLLGVTATPLRMGNINLGDIFSSMVIGASVNQLIDLGNLTDFDYFAPDTNIDLSHVRSKFGEYVKSDLAAAMDDTRIIGSIVDNYRLYANGKSAICYCVNVEHSKSVANSFTAAGISAAHVDGETPAAIREQLVDDFRAGKIKVLCNAELFSEGFDVPRCQAVILARPTKSLTLYIQQAMRSMRPDKHEPDKRAVIIDHVQNYRRFGLPDLPRDWCLDPAPPKQQGEPPVKQCPQCCRVLPISTRICPNCQYVFFSQDDAQDRLKQHSGNLKKIQRDKKISGSGELIKHAPSSPEEFLSIAKVKGYKIGWVAFQALRHAKSLKDCLHIAKVCGYNTGWAWHKWREIEPKLSISNILPNA